MLRLLCLPIGVILLPILYFWLCQRMRRDVPKPPRLPWFFVFGTVGGYLLLFAFGPSFLSFMVGYVFLLIAFLCLIWGWVASLLARPRTRYHRTAATASVLLMAGVVTIFVTPGFGGLSHAGHWKNDPKNWSRAFNGMPLPPGCKVLRSEYIRSPHFTYEAAYYLEFTAPQEFMDRWIEGQHLGLEKPTSETAPKFETQPDWFLSQPLENYEMWTNGEACLFRDRASGAWLVADEQF